MGPTILDRARGCAVGAAVGDALGMPLEFGPRHPVDALVRDMLPGRQPPGAFTDDTEMALALAESLLAQRPLDPADLAARFVAWFRGGPRDIGRHTRLVLTRIRRGAAWEDAVAAISRENPWSAANGSVMRAWPVALAWWDDLDALLADSATQGRITHVHPECVAGSIFVNAAIYYLLHGAPPDQALAAALDDAAPPLELRWAIREAAAMNRAALGNTGWVRHTLQSAAWALLTTDSFEEAVIQAVNLGDDADTVGAVTGALAGAAYGLAAIPPRWRELLRGEWPLRSKVYWEENAFVDLADRLVAR